MNIHLALNVSCVLTALKEDIGDHVVCDHSGCVAFWIPRTREWFELQQFEVGCLLLGLEGINIFFENMLILEEVKFYKIHKYLIVQFTRLW